MARFMLLDFGTVIILLGSADYTSLGKGLLQYFRSSTDSPL